MGIFKKIVDWIKSFTTNPGSTGPIKHVIVLMFENHSFDQMLGCFNAVFPGEINGVDATNPGSNKDSTGRIYLQRTSSDPVVSPDPKHELDHILNQLKDNNNGFVSEYEKEYPDTKIEQRQRIMDYFGLDDLPALHALARNFTICEQWYSSVPGPTWTNRFFVHSGTSKGIIDMPESIKDTDLYLDYDQDTIFDRLNEKRIAWRVYFGDIPQSLVLRHQQAPKNALHYRLMHEFYSDIQGPAMAFPSYTFIEPNYFFAEQNDDHPPHSTMRAQRLLAHVYNALRKNEDLWNSTLLVVLYDEHGGFYDHVSPPAAVPPDQFQDKFTFDRFGVRVPALLISPWVDRQVISTRFDHTSLLKYLTELWGIRQLTERVQDARTFTQAFRSSARTDTPTSVPVPPLMTEGGPLGSSYQELAAPKNENQQALMVFSKHLEQQTVIPAAPGPMTVEAIATEAGPLVESHLAKQRVEAFLNQQKTIAMVS